MCERVSVRPSKLLPNTREITKGLGSKARHFGVSPSKHRALCDLVSVLLTNHLTPASCSPVTGLSQQRVKAPPLPLTEASALSFMMVLTYPPALSGKTQKRAEGTKIQICLLVLLILKQRWQKRQPRPCGLCCLGGAGWLLFPETPILGTHPKESKAAFQTKTLHTYWWGPRSKEPNVGQWVSEQNVQMTE